MAVRTQIVRKSGFFQLMFYIIVFCKNIPFFLKNNLRFLTPTLAEWDIAYAGALFILTSSCIFNQEWPQKPLKDFKISWILSKVRKIWKLPSRKFFFKARIFFKNLDFNDRCKNRIEHNNEKIWSRFNNSVFKGMQFTTKSQGDNLPALGLKMCDFFLKFKSVYGF